MDKQSALEFLKSRQPMPDDGEITSELAQGYAQVAEFFTANPDAEALPLFFGSLTSGDGAGSFPLLEGVLLAADRSAAIKALCDALQNEHSSAGARFWATLFSVNFICDEVVGALETSLKYASEDMKELIKEQIEMFRQML